MATPPWLPFHWLRRAGSLLPGACALCAATGPHVLCEGCRQQFFGAATHDRRRCRCCAVSLAEAVTPDSSTRTAVQATLCGQCLRRPPAFDTTVAAASYAAPVDQLVLGLKFGGRLALAPLFGALLRDAILANKGLQVADTGALPELLIPVPLGADRLRERGFNQALEITRPLAGALGIPLAPRLLARIRETSQQARLGPDARRSNLRGAFALTADNRDGVRGRHVGVVDDVMTTGETLNEIAAVLKRFGAVRVTNLVVARTEPA